MLQNLMIYLIKPFITQIYIFNKQLVTNVLLIYNEQILLSLVYAMVMNVIDICLLKWVAWL